MLCTIMQNPVPLDLNYDINMDTIELSLIYGSPMEISTKPPSPMRIWIDGGEWTSYANVTTLTFFFLFFDRTPIVDCCVVR